LPLDTAQQPCIMDPMEINVVILGDESETKKSHIIMKFVEDHGSKYDPDDRSVLQPFHLSNGEQVAFQITPLHIAPRFKLSKKYKPKSEEQFAAECYRSANILIILYNPCDLRTYEKAKLFMEQFHKMKAKGNMHDYDVVPILIGHKLKNFKRYNREITESDGRDFAHSQDFEFEELSIRDKSIHSLFDRLGVYLEGQRNNAPDERSTKSSSPSPIAAINSLIRRWHSDDELKSDGRSEGNDTDTEKTVLRRELQNLQLALCDKNAEIERLKAGARDRSISPRPTASQSLNNINRRARPQHRTPGSRTPGYRTPGSNSPSPSLSPSPDPRTAGSRSTLSGTKGRSRANTGTQSPVHNPVHKKAKTAGFQRAESTPKLKSTPSFDSVPGKTPGFFSKISSNLNVFHAAKSVDTLHENDSADLQYQLEKAQKWNNLLKKQVQTLQKDKKVLKNHCEKLNEQLLKSKMKLKSMKHRHRDLENKLKSKEKTLAENAQEFADYQSETDEKVRRFQKEKVAERRQKKEIEEKYKALTKEHIKLQLKYEKLKAETGTTVYSPKVSKHDADDSGCCTPLTTPFNLDGDDMKRVDAIQIAARSSFSNMDSEWSVPQLLRTIERLKTDHFSNFVEEIVDEEGDEEDEHEMELLTKRACKFLFCTLIEAYSVITAMYAATDGDNLAYARTLCALTPTILRQRVYETMKERFSEEYMMWFDTASNGNRNRDLFRKYILKCLNVCNGMAHFGQQKDAINLSFFPMTFEGVDRMSKKLDIYEYGQVMIRDDLFDPTPKGDVWGWHCSFPGVVEYGNEEVMEGEDIMKVIDEHRTDKFSMFRSRMFVFKSE